MEILSFLRKIKNIFLIAILASHISPCDALASDQLKVIGQVVWAKGTVKAVLPNAEPRVLARRSEVYEHDTLTSDPAGTGEIVFTDNSVLSLRESSTVQIDHYNYNKGVAKGKDTFVMSVAKGGFRTVTGAISKNNPGGYKATTPVAIIGVSGTRYSIYFDAAKKSMAAKLDQGTIFISNPQGQIKLQRCMAGEGDCINHLYAQVRGRNVAPVIVKQEPAVFKVEPPLTTTNGFPDSGTTSPTTESSQPNTSTTTESSQPNASTTTEPSQSSTTTTTTTTDSSKSTIIEGSFCIN